jgi:hypothetical protein
MTPMTTPPEAATAALTIPLMTAAAQAAAPIPTGPAAGIFKHYCAAPHISLLKDLGILIPKSFFLPPPQKKNTI